MLPAAVGFGVDVDDLGRGASMSSTIELTR